MSLGLKSDPLDHFVQHKQEEFKNFAEPKEPEGIILISDSNIRMNKYICYTHEKYNCKLYSYNL